MQQFNKIFTARFAFYIALPFLGKEEKPKEEKVFLCAEGERRTKSRNELNDIVHLKLSSADCGHY